MATVYLIERGCPICGNDLKGNDELRYFCRNCNILFDHKDIHVPPKKYHAPDKVKIESAKIELATRSAAQTRVTDEEETPPLFPKKKALSEDFDKEKLLRAVPEVVEEKNEEKKELKQEESALGAGVVEAETEPFEDEPAASTGFELEGEEKIIASKESTKLHAGNCRFVSKIHHTNRQYFASVSEGQAKGYELCVCLRRIRALERR